MSYSQIREDLLLRKISCTDLVNHTLSMIRLNNERLNLFLEVFEDEAIQRAIEIDNKIAHGKQGALAGLIVGIKDLFCFEGHAMTCGSKILEGFTSLITATPIQRLLDQDAIIIGRQNCDEFGMGSSNENSAYGPTKNPIDERFVTGGSSGGSAAAVAAGMCHISLGSDTGGSVRQPAAFCGVVGFKPTYGRISRYGLTAYCSSFDNVGLLASSIDDVCLVLEAVSGKDEKDSTSSSLEVPNYYNSLKTTISKKRVGVFKNIVNSNHLHPRIATGLHDSIGKLKRAGYSISEYDFPYLEALLPTYYILTSAEASSNLARYDGMHYGQQIKSSNGLLETYKKTRTNFFGKEVLRRILLGTFVLTANQQEAFYRKALQVRKQIKKYTEEIFTSCDYLMLPTTPTLPFRIGDKTMNPMEMYLSDIFTVHASVAGIPAISLPLNKNPDQFPIGVQFMSASFEEEELLKFSNHFLTL